MNVNKGELRSSLASNKQAILQTLDIGSGIAENDDILDECRIETKQFRDLLSDKVDLIPGTKGSGKSAIYRLFTDYVASWLIEKQRIIPIKGVETKGDPIFNYFAPEFDAFTEDEFRVFWKLYIIYLLWDQFIDSPRFADEVLMANDLKNEFMARCRDLAFPPLQPKASLSTMVQDTLNYVKKLKPFVRHKWGDPNLGETEIGAAPPEEDRDTAGTKPSDFPMVDRVIETAISILRQCTYTAWVMMDQLDTVFKRRTPTERTALRSLLYCSFYMGNDHLKIKVFLRDDILDYLSETAEGFAGLDHIVDRKSDTLSWDGPQIERLVAKRLLHNQLLRQLFGVTDLKSVDDDFRLVQLCFDVLFPDRINKQEPIGWLLNYLSDGRQVITPRDVINLLKAAVEEEIKLVSQGKVEPSLFSSAALLKAWQRVSKDKKDTVLYPEFPHLRTHIECFEGGKHKYSVAELEKLLGDGYSEKMKSLISVGVLNKRREQEEDVFVIPRIYRPSLKIVEKRKKRGKF
jgi:hypothetical protein